MDEKEVNGRYTLQIRCTDEDRERFKAISRDLNKPTGLTLSILMSTYDEMKGNGSPLMWLKSAGKEEKEISEAIETLTRSAYELSKKAAAYKNETITTRESMKEEYEALEKKYNSMVQEKNNTIDQLETEIERLKGLEDIAKASQKGLEVVQAVTITLKEDNEKLEKENSSFSAKVSDLERQVSELKGRLSVYEALKK